MINIREIIKEVGEFDDEHQIERIILIGKDEEVKQIILEDEEWMI